MTTVQEQIENALVDLALENNWFDVVVAEDIAAALMPLVKRAQAEALREASWKYTLECRNPADVRDMIRAEAERIEKEAGA